MILQTNAAADLASLASQTAAVAALGPLNLATVDLCQADIGYDRNTTLATLLDGIATYVGYAQGVITWGVPSIADDGTIECIGTVPVFRPTNGVTPNNIFGLFIQNAGGTLLKACARFDSAPLPMDNASRIILITIRWRNISGGVVDVIS